MPWARVDADFPQHPKLAKLREALRSPLAEVYVVRLWCWTLKYAPGGDLTPFSNAAVAAGCGYRGDADRFVDALVSAGFLDVTPVPGRDALTRREGDATVVHDWFEHSGKYETDTASGRERVRRFRERQRVQNGDVTITQRPEVKRSEEKDPPLPPHGGDQHTVGRRTRRRSPRGRVEQRGEGTSDPDQVAASLAWEEVLQHARCTNGHEPRFGEAIRTALLAIGGIDVLSQVQAGEEPSATLRSKFRRAHIQACRAAAGGGA